MFFQLGKSTLLLKTTALDRSNLLNERNLMRSHSSPGHQQEDTDLADKTQQAVLHLHLSEGKDMSMYAAALPCSKFP